MDGVAATTTTTATTTSNEANVASPPTRGWGRVRADHQVNVENKVREQFAAQAAMPRNQRRRAAVLTSGQRMIHEVIKRRRWIARRQATAHCVHSVCPERRLDIIITGVAAATVVTLGILFSCCVIAFTTLNDPPDNDLMKIVVFSSIGLTCALISCMAGITVFRDNMAEWELDPDDIHD